MTTVAELQRLRVFARAVTDLQALAEIRMMIAELERRSRQLGNGDAGGDIGDRLRERDETTGHERRLAAAKTAMASRNGPSVLSVIASLASNRSPSHGTTAPAFEAAIPILSRLLKAETAERGGRSMAYQPKPAPFPAYRDLSCQSRAARCVTTTSRYAPLTIANQRV